MLGHQKVLTHPASDSQFSRLRLPRIIPETSSISGTCVGWFHYFHIAKSMGAGWGMTCRYWKWAKGIRSHLLSFHVIFSSWKGRLEGMRERQGKRHKSSPGVHLDQTPGSNSRGQGRSRESGREQRSCWGTLGWTESSHKVWRSIMSACTSELLAPVKIKQKLMFAKDILSVRQCAGRHPSVMIINPHHNKAGIIMAILHIRKLRSRMITCPRTWMRQ